MKVAFALLAIVFLAAAVSAQAGVQIGLSESGLQYLVTQSVAIANQKLSGQVITVPDDSGSSGSFDYSITDIKLSHLSLKSSKATLVPNVGMSLATSDISADVSANWSGRDKHWPHPHGSGSLSIDLSGVDATVEVQMSIVSGRLHVAGLKSSVSIQSLSIHFSGSHLDWLLNLIKSVMEKKIKSALQDGIAKALENAVSTTLEDMIANLPTCMDIGSSGLGVDYMGVGALQVSSSLLQGGVTGYAFPAGHHSPPPLPSPSLPSMPSLSPEPMVELMVSEYTVESAGYAVSQSPNFNYTFDNSQVPSGSPLTLNTSSWAQTVPPLASMYPNHLMVAHVALAKAPIVNIVPSSVTVDLEIALRLDVITGPSTFEPALGIGILVNITVDPTITGTNLTGQLTGLHPGCEILWSTVGSFDSSTLCSLIIFSAAEGGGVLQNYLKTGLPLPVIDGYKFVNPVVHANAGYLLIATAIEASPSSTPRAAPYGSTC